MTRITEKGEFEWSVFEARVLGRNCWGPLWKGGILTAAPMNTEGLDASCGAIVATVLLVHQQRRLHPFCVLTYKCKLHQIMERRTVSREMALPFVTVYIIPKTCRCCKNSASNLDDLTADTGSTRFSEGGWLQDLEQEQHLGRAI